MFSPRRDSSFYPASPENQHRFSIAAAFPILSAEIFLLFVSWLWVMTINSSKAKFCLKLMKIIKHYMAPKPLEYV